MFNEHEIGMYWLLYGQKTVNTQSVNVWLMGDDCVHQYMNEQCAFGSIMDYAKNAIYFGLTVCRQSMDFWYFVASHVVDLRLMYAMDEQELMLAIFLQLELLLHKGYILPQLCFNVTEARRAYQEADASPLTLELMKHLDFVPVSFQCPTTSEHDLEYESPAEAEVDV